MTPPEDESLQTQPHDASSEEGVAADEEAKQKLSLEVEVARTSDCERHVTVTISREDIDRYLADAIKDLMPTAAVPGFRPGRAPRKLVESRFREQTSEQVKGAILMDSLTQVSEEQEFSAISEPDFDFEAIELPAEGPMVFEFDLEVRPEFDLPEWKGLILEKPTRTFTREDVDRQLHKILTRYSPLVPSKEPVAEGDHITIDATFKKDDRILSELDEETVRVKPTLSFHDGKITDFDKLVVGAKVGDERTAEVTISDEAENEELRGAKVSVRIKVREVKREDRPELNEEMLGALGGFDSEGDLRDAIMKELERQLAYHQQQRSREQITQKLTQGADWQLPPDLLRRQGQRELQRAVLELRRAGFSDQDIRAYENDLRQNSLASTARALKEHFILERIAEDQEIDAEPGDYDMEVALIAAQSGESPRRVRARLEKHGQMDSLRNQIIERKVIEMIAEQAKFTEVDFQFEDSSTEAVDHAIGGRSLGDIPAAKHTDEAAGLREPADHS